ncbi:MAG: preprotein translocase subunit SecA [Deltaproteobacteria bacterium]|nr:preprotein translocase subunit SecA [Deltaproteobacteria bacterium]
MFGKVLQKVFGTRNERVLKDLWPVVRKVNSLEEAISRLSNDELKNKTNEFKERIAKGESLDDLLPEAFAVVREVSRRTTGMRHFDVQIMGGIVLHQGNIAEMKTGEGKTLVATLPIYLNALLEKGVHLVTVNDYLAKRDALWMGPIYKFLGLSVGVIQGGNKSHLVDWEDESTFKTTLLPCTRKEAYQADVTYGTNNEFGFDYLRDNMQYSIENYVQRELYYAIVDEVDFLLIDEARTPLIISGPTTESTRMYYEVDKAVRTLTKEDVEVDEKMRTATFTDSGISKIQKILGIDNLFDVRYMEILHMVNQSLRAHTLFRKDRDYIVKKGKVIIVDEFTGRIMPDRRYSDGLHQALEAKEHVRIQKENQTLATITFQNYFRMYEKLAGMTGTAATEEREFKEIYNLEVTVIPTNKPMIRKDYDDVIYKTEKEKLHAIVDEIKERHKKGQPILVGTTSVEKSEVLHRMLVKEHIPHTVLNAKHHEKEAQIIAHAGEKNAVTIATNMAGRGVDIKLGEGVEKLGGLFILGTERHESRRIDNQLRGRSGRQGDVGESRFYLSLEDDLLRIFGSERLKLLMDKLGVPDGEPIQNKFVTKAISNAQKRVEAYNFDIRKHLLEYDDVMNKQREIIYTQRKEILKGMDLRDSIFEDINDIIVNNMDIYLPETTDPENWDTKGFRQMFKRIFNLELPLSDEEIKNRENREKIRDEIVSLVKKFYLEREKLVGSDEMREIERMIMLQVVDVLWKEHLRNMDYLRESTGLRGYGQRDPLIEYKRESFEMFERLIEEIKEYTIINLFHIKIAVGK